MGLLDVVLHALNFLSPALGLGLIAPALAKLLWRQHLRSVPWHGLARWTFLAGTVPLLAGLVITASLSAAPAVPFGSHPLTYASSIYPAAGQTAVGRCQFRQDR